MEDWKRDDFQADAQTSGQLGGTDAPEEPKVQQVEFEQTAYNEYAAYDKREGYGWHQDDLQQSWSEPVSPQSNPLKVIEPKRKKSGGFKRFIKKPATIAVVSSILTCAVCFSAFAFGVLPRTLPRVTGAVPQGAAGYSATAGLMNQDGKSGEPQTLASKNDLLTKATGAELTIAEINEKAGPTVVSIINKATVSNSRYLKQSVEVSSGSGIILTADGYIVTNNHVVEGANELQVTTIGGQDFTAKLIGTDSQTDLAVIKVESDQPLPYAELGDSADLQVGDLAVAIGNPLRKELAGTVTAGIISAINRTMTIDNKQMTMLQTDAAINPGNSGGALLNNRGQVIGINTAKSQGYDVEGLGFAIPINEAKPVIDSIMKNGYVTGRPIIGIGGVTVSSEMARVNGIPEGVYVKTISSLSAAERAGLQVGDVIIKCEGEEVKTIDDINKIRDQHKPGDTITMTVDRNGRQMSISLTLQEDSPELQQKQQEEEQRRQQEEQKRQQQQQQQQPSIADLFPWLDW